MTGTEVLKRMEDMGQRVMAHQRILDNIIVERLLLNLYETNYYIFYKSLQEKEAKQTNGFLS
jgi:hypothetical protein